MRVIAGVTAVLVTVSVAASSCAVIGRHSASAPSALAADFTVLEKRLQAKIGLIVSAVGANPQQMTLGEWASGPAWSTMKVPLIIAALGEEHPPAITDPMRVSGVPRAPTLNGALIFG